MLQQFCSMKSGRTEKEKKRTIQRKESNEYATQYAELSETV